MDYEKAATTYSCEIEVIGSAKIVLLRCDWNVESQTGVQVVITEVITLTIVLVLFKHQRFSCLINNGDVILRLSLMLTLHKVTPLKLIIH